MYSYVVGCGIKVLVYTRFRACCRIDCSAHSLRENYTLSLDPYEFRNYLSDDFVKAVKREAHYVPTPKS